MSRIAPLQPGQKFARLTVIRLMPDRNKWKQRMYELECKCGTRIIANGSDVKTGHTNSCGCVLREKTVKRNTKHGLTYSRTYSIWCAMKTRVLNPNVDNYKHYGGRGIKLCPRWQRSFKAFLKDMGEAPQGHTIERIDNNGPYRPSNCKWATKRDQSNNTRRNRFVTFHGKRMTVAEWARASGCSASAFYKRLARGLSDEEAINLPPKVASVFRKMLEG